MTDPGKDPEQDAAQDAAHDSVRRLLADARHDEPVPDVVRARLDATLAELTAERREERSSAAVVDLSARRRHRRRTGLLAAAAVVVVGVGLGQVLDSGGDARSGAQDASSAESSTSMTQDDDSAGLAESALPSTAAKKPSTDAAASSASPVVRSDHLRTDLRQLLPAPTEKRGRVQNMYDAPTCAAPVLGPGSTQVPITLDGAPAVAVLQPAADGRRKVEVFACASGVELHSVSFRVP